VGRGLMMVRRRIITPAPTFIVGAGNTKEYNQNVGTGPIYETVIAISAGETHPAEWAGW
jgi:hypothetical protein